MFFWKCKKTRKRNINKLSPPFFQLFFSLILSLSLFSQQLLFSPSSPPAESPSRLFIPSHPLLFFFDSQFFSRASLSIFFLLFHHAPTLLLSLPPFPSPPNFLEHTSALLKASRGAIFFLIYFSCSINAFPKHHDFHMVLLLNQRKRERERRRERKRKKNNKIMIL